MADCSNREILLELVKRDGNNVCADCRKEDPEWASSNIGVFLCTDCASLHRNFGTDISRIRSLKLDNWDSDQVKVIQEKGNKLVNEIYEKHVPNFIRRPGPGDTVVLKKEWIKAKYIRKEFQDPSKQSSYNCQKKEGVLYKKGRDDNKYQKRKFILNRETNKLTYYAKEHIRDSEKPKAEIYLDDVNAVFVPEKTGQANGLQITYIQKGSTRNLFVYSDDIVDWYYAIRSAKLERRKIAFPDRDELDLAEDLTRDFLLEGWLSKMGPKNEPFKKRWFTLDKRKLMYLEDPVQPFPKGEIFIGHRDGDYSVSMGSNDNLKNSQMYIFTLHTPERDFILSAETREDMNQWICELQRIMELPLTPQDTKLASLLVAKRSNSFRMSGWQS